MQRAAFDVGEDGPQRAAGYCRSLVGPDHHRQLATVVAPLFDRLVAPPDNQEALSLNCDLFGFRHDAE